MCDPENDTFQAFFRTIRLSGRHCRCCRGAMEDLESAMPENTVVTTIVLYQRELTARYEAKELAKK